MSSNATPTTFLEFVVFTGPRSLRAVTLRNGERRHVVFKWMSLSGELPGDWWTAILGELDFQDTERFNEARGRSIPR